MAEPTLDLVLLWHMHQPDYRDHSLGGEFALPWAYLHALKDYSDMASHLERHPAIRCVVNFVPVLLDQIEDYADQFATAEFRDPLLRLMARENLDGLSGDERRLLLGACFRNNHHTMLTPFPGYQRLHEIFLNLTRPGATGLSYLSGSYFSDLLTWYHLAWTGEDARRRNEVVARLLSQGSDYDFADRRALLNVMGEVVAGILPRYRALAERGQIELSATPETHPLSPLLIDFGAAREALPEASLPLASGYPGGRDRVVRQVADARQSHARRFGEPPTGMWPAEGAVSEAFAEHAARSGCRWIASGEGVLRASLHASGIDATRAAYRPWTLPSAPGLKLFFRDERLSDLIGFDYAKWHGRDAAAHLVNALEDIRRTSPEGETPVVGIILDGENAWEHYPYNGYFFFEDLYGMLADHPGIRTRTYAEIVAHPESHPPAVLPRLVAGSWVYGSLSTWIGDEQKNRAWDLLCAAKQNYDRVAASGQLDADEAARATRQLAICESSDWFWWFGDTNPAEAVASFDRLFRHNLGLLYARLKLEPPRELALPISRAAEGATVSAAGSDRAGTDGAGTMRRATPEGAHR